MNGYFLEEAAASRHADLLRTAQGRRRARRTRLQKRAAGSVGSAGRTRGAGVRHAVLAVPVAVRGFVYRGWIAPPAAMVEGKAPGDSRGAERANLAYGPAGTATSAGFCVPAGHGAA